MSRKKGGVQAFMGLRGTNQGTLGIHYTPRFVANIACSAPSGRVCPPLSGCWASDTN